MTDTYFQEMMEEFGCSAQKNFAFGVYQGYPFSAEHDRAEDPEMYTVRFAVDGSARPCLADLKETGGQHVRWFAEKDTLPGGGVLVAVAQPPSDFYSKATIHGLLHGAKAVLEKNGLKPGEICPLCGNTGCDGYAYLEDDYRKTHQNCVETRLELPEEDEKPQARKTRGNLFTGIAGALLGAYIGALPNWAQAFSKGRITPILYAFIPLFSAMLYRLFRGKANKILVAFTVLGASFIAAFSLELVWYWLMLTAHTGKAISFAESISYYLANHTFGTTIREMLTSLLFMIAGFFPASVIMRRYTEDGEERAVVRRGARFVKNSLLPLAAEEKEPPATPQPPEEKDTVRG